MPIARPTRRQLSWFVASISPWLVAGKCVPYNHAYDEDAFGKKSSAGSGGDTAEPTQGTGGGGSVVPATECSSAGTARLTVETFYFNPTCGCAEEEGLACTVNAGTEVIWTFADSEAHNVTSVPDTFGGSADSLTGTFAFEFTEPGEYPYGCTIHSEMRGFSIIVE